MTRTIILFNFLLAFRYFLVAQETKTIHKNKIQNKGDKWYKAEGDRKFLVDESILIIKLKSNTDEVVF